ncbi:MAG TPA: NADPH-dependent 7-cyano-7-deazaguanine reductase QueF [Pusillimonas sp.]|uniref:NADPH-dependent 7-cyano-7-deazaguanine reductase QueF n=1 Tax=unclassified Pusillimonas TaxID=2640016 RepID=UPI0026242084|nr:MULTISPECIES: NADPH-dependent 7-cyano-7-deazaguanine reductase QueF [unclassified Pusillimonas]HLU18372.1 NADPH-dependent 7-cyano-7-deazaguanine reductase QueF [Pusillimonas sp.]
MNSRLDNAPLGQNTVYPTAYDAALLYPIERAPNRLALGTLPDWIGADIWNAYEISWLNSKGKPVVATATFTVPQNSPNLVESKSFKLYLNSFNEERFEDQSEVVARMRRDISAACGAQVEVELLTLAEQTGSVYRPMDGINIDDIDVEIDVYTPSPNLLQCVPGANDIEETLVSDLLKSNCPVTGQPDWATVQIRYAGPQIDRSTLLKYIVSLRRHDEFHEHCVEKMYCDIWRVCKPRSLLVYARYTRRGGLDINPWRASHAAQVDTARTVRQ